MENIRINTFDEDMSDPFFTFLQSMQKHTFKKKIKKIDRLQN